MRSQPEIRTSLPSEVANGQKPKNNSALPQSESAWLSKAAGEFHRPTDGDYRSAYDAVSNNPNLPKDLTQTFRDVPIKAGDLKAGLQDHLAQLQVGEATISVNGKMGITEPRTVIELDGGAHVDLISRPGEKPMTIDGRPLTTAEISQINSLRQSVEGQRVIAEHAAVKMEEMIHVRQMQNGGKPISKTYEDFRAWSGEPPLSENPSMSDQRRHAELDVVAAMYDAGFPVEMLSKHFENQYLDRKSLMNYFA